VLFLVDITRLHGKTALDLAIKEAVNELLVAKDNATKCIVLLTDGVSNSHEAAVEQAKLAKSQVRNKTALLPLGKTTIYLILLGHYYYWSWNWKR